MKMNRQTQFAGNPFNAGSRQKWYIGGLTVLLLGAGGTWAFNSNAEPATYRHQQTAATRRKKTDDTPKFIKHNRSPRIAIERPSYKNRRPKHNNNNKTDRKDRKKDNGRKTKKDKSSPPA